MINQVQSQTQQHKILPQQIALLNIFHLDTLALEQRIQDEINDNPLLEQSGEDNENIDKFSKDTVQDFQNSDESAYDDIPDYKVEYGNYLATDNIPERPLAETIDFRAELKKQFRLNEPDDLMYAKADFIIDSLNEKGFLDQTLDAVSEEISFKEKTWVTAEDLEEVLRKIQLLEPLGVASRDIREYMIIQLKKMDTRRPDVKKALCLLEDHFATLRTGNLEKIRRSLSLEEDEIKIVLDLLASLQTSPVTDFLDSHESNNTILPDFLITFEEDQLEVALNRECSSKLHINHSWAEKIGHIDQDANVDKSSKQYLRSKMNSAQWFINAIRERESNMLKIMRAIVDYQYNYFCNGDPMQLKPMVLKNIAARVNLDISTVSRLTCNKYADTPFGTILLKDLFTEGIINKEGDVISNRVLQEMISELVEAEDKKKPYTDQQLANLLSSRGYNIARRTITKYREQLNIAVAQIRRLQV